MQHSRNIEKNKKSEFNLVEVFSQHSAGCRKVAFTLAEVLITLGIIGIVAAMTIPTLMASYQKMVFKNQYKKLYSTIYQAYTKSVFDVGGSTECYHYNISTSEYGKWWNNTICGDFREAVEKNLSIAKICNTKAVDNGCLKKDQYKGFDSLLIDQNPDMTNEEIEFYRINCPGTTTTRIHNNNLVYVLNDGTIIISDNPNIVPISMIVDVNGQKGPNKWGYDLFKMSFHKDGDNYKLGPIGGCGVSSFEKGGISSMEMWRQMND